jgi:hypothetical protein
VKNDGTLKDLVAAEFVAPINYIGATFIKNIFQIWGFFFWHLLKKYFNLRAFLAFVQDIQDIEFTL